MDTPEADTLPVAAAKPDSPAPFGQLLSWIDNGHIALIIVLGFLRPCDLHGLVVRLALAKLDWAVIYLLQHCYRDIDLAIAKQTPDKFRCSLASGGARPREPIFPEFSKMVDCGFDPLFEMLIRARMWGTVTKQYYNRSTRSFPRVHEFIWWGLSHGRSGLVRLALEVEQIDFAKDPDFAWKEITPWRKASIWEEVCGAGDLGGARFLLEESSQMELHVGWIEFAVVKGHLPVALELLQSGWCPSDPFPYPHPHWHNIVSLCTAGHIRELDWLKDYVWPRWHRYRQPRRRPRAQILDDFKDVCEGGNTVGAEWYANMFSITDREAQFQHCRILREACDKGLIPMARWIVARFRVQRKKVAHWAARSERAYQTQGPQESLEWLATEFV